MMIYVVQKGDTLTGIGEKYGVSADFLSKANMLEAPDELVIGQTIVIPENNPKIGSIATNGYLYVNIDEEILRKTLPYLTFATIFTYGFTEDGELVIPNDDKALNIIKEYDTKPIMLISTLGADGRFSNELANTLLNDEALQDTVIGNILEVMEQKGYFGLDIDFEYVLPEDEQAFIDFIDKTRNILNSNGYPVITSLAPKVSAEQKGLLYEAHNYGEIGSVSDAVLLMTYEWGYTFGPPMAVAPINKVKEVLDYAVTEIPREKIFMGIPNYGYDWTLPYVKGESRAKSIGNVEGVDIAREYGAEIQYDEVSQAPYFMYYKDGIEHIVWFEDARSIETKLRTANEYGFSGVSYWNIMRWFPQNWLVLSQLFDIYKIPN